MPQKECPSCAVKVDKMHTVCPVCGYEFPQPKSTVKWIAVIMVLLFAWPLIKLLIALF
ncbi:hypothetical protein JXQ31_20285 [candidate division KSB1 bacterium]|nr:hypothetical protein [candidate division KSB1 bacterium]